MPLNLDAMAQEAVLRLNHEINRRAGQRLRRLRERWACEQGLGLHRPVRKPEDLQESLIDTPAMYILRITQAIAHHWIGRGIWDGIPGLAGRDIKAGRLGVDLKTLEDITADCRLMAGDTIENSPGERHAYRSLLAHCESVRMVGPVEPVEDED